MKDVDCGDDEPGYDDGIITNRQSGKKCRTCGRTNCEGGSQCEMYAEMHNKDQESKGSFPSILLR